MPGPGAFLIGDEELKEVTEVLLSKHLGRYGDESDPNFKRKVMTLEKEFAAKMGVRYAVAVNSGTSAIMASLKALGIGPGDEVLVPGYTFIATMSAAITVGALPVLVEVDDSLTVDPNDLEKKISPNTRAIIPVHMLGNPCDMDAVSAVARRHGLFIIEDTCQSMGGTYKNRMLGTFGQLGAFSLNAFKVIGAGDAGILVTDERDFYERAFGFHDQGHLPLRHGVEVGNRSLIGINMIMNELTGAFALAQLRKLDRILGLLREKKNRFKNAIAGAGLRGLSFRTINDPGECHTFVTIRMDTVELAERVARSLGTRTLDQSGWHVYNNMEQLLSHTDPSGRRPYHKNMLPRTDDLLRRSVNLSIGVVDSGIGSDFGINILSDNDEIDRTAEEFVTRVRHITG